VLDRREIQALLACCAPSHRLLLCTAIFTGMRISELLGLIWSDIDLEAGVLHVRAQLSVPRRGAPGQRVPTKTRASVREIPLAAPLVHLLGGTRAARNATGAEWVFITSATTAHAQRNVTRRGLRLAAQRAGIDDGTRPRLRFHDLRHTFASHLIVDLGLDVARVSRILGHAHISTTLDIYTHLFDHARHHGELRAQLTASSFVALLAPHVPVAAARSRAGVAPALGPGPR
jgi:integrase